MRDFKVMKELIKALTYIGDAIAGTNKSSNSQGESNDVYDGILKVSSGTKDVMFSFGIKDNDNAITLGDLFTDNFINDLNNDENINLVSTVAKLNDEIIRTRGGSSTASFIDGSVQFENDGTNFIIAILYGGGNGVKVTYTTNLSRPFTKDTLLTKLPTD